MMTVDRVQQLQLSRYEWPWRRVSPYFPAAPNTPSARRRWSDRLKRWVWRALHRRL